MRFKIFCIGLAVILFNTLTVSETTAQNSFGISRISEQTISKKEFVFSVIDSPSRKILLDTDGFKENLKIKLRFQSVNQNSYSSVFNLSIASDKQKNFLLLNKDYILLSSRKHDIDQ